MHQAGGSGEVEKKRYKEIADVWGKLPEKDRERIRQEMRDKMSSKDRAMLDAYIREMQNKQNVKK